MDDEPLTKIFCEDEQDTVNKQLPFMNPCCACQEARYEMTVERLWSRHTHPKDFPSDALSTKISDIIGASHTVTFKLWDYGTHASDGLTALAEHGSTIQLENEMKDHKERNAIRTIIKAREIIDPGDTTSSVFRVDSEHHLISLVAKVDPSPDWILGISCMELCLSNCSWLERKTLNLYPWDAGTDSGSSYIVSIYT